MWELQGEMQNLRVSLTLPVLPSELTREGLGVYHIFYNGSIVIDSVNSPSEANNDIPTIPTQGSNVIVEIIGSPQSAVPGARSLFNAVKVTPRRKARVASAPDDKS